MGLPKEIICQDQRYPLIILVAAGNKHTQIRPIKHKFERSLLSRLNDAVTDVWNKNEDYFNKIRDYLNADGESVLPVAIQKEETITPNLVRPELFLWRSFSQEDGLPLFKPYLYETDFTTLSADQLHTHVHNVLEDYHFLAEISDHSKQYWLNEINLAFHKHPLIKLYHKKKQLIHAIDTMNKSSLLAVLKYPEDIALWRKRAVVVMRPFQQLPEAWLENAHSTCGHEKQLMFDASSRSICCKCDTCSFRVIYQVDQRTVHMEEEPDPLLVERRLDGIETQFEKIMGQNESLLEQLAEIKSLKRQLSKGQKTLEESLEISKRIERYQMDRFDLSRYPALEMYAALKHVIIPVRKKRSTLIWLAAIQLEDVRIFKQLPSWRNSLSAPAGTAHAGVLAELKVELETVRFGSEDIIVTVKDRSLTYKTVQQILDLVYYYGREHPAHTLVQVLAGKATHKLRSLYLHETRWFGLLAEWPEKYIQKLFNQLEKRGWLMKQRKGYSISHFAQEVM